MFMIPHSHYVFEFAVIQIKVNNKQDGTFVILYFGVKIFQSSQATAGNSRKLSIVQNGFHDNGRQRTTLQQLHDRPQFTYRRPGVDEKTLDVVHNVFMLQCTRHGDLLRDQIKTLLFEQVHLFDGHPLMRRLNFSREDCTRCTARSRWSDQQNNVQRNLFQNCKCTLNTPIY